MRAFSVGLVAALGLIAAPDMSEARDGCGRGYFFDGYRCVPYRGGYYGGGYYRGGYGPRYNPNYGRPTYDQSGTISCNVPGYTWQHGACRPYTGR